MKVLAAKTFRAGRQSLLFDGQHYYVRIVNRTYESTVPIPAEKAAVWRGILR